MRGLGRLLIAAALSIGALPAAADSDRHGTAMSHHAFAHRKFRRGKVAVGDALSQPLCLRHASALRFGWGSYGSPPPPVVAVSPPPPARLAARRPTSGRPSRRRRAASRSSAAPARATSGGDGSKLGRYREIDGKS